MQQKRDEIRITNKHFDVISVRLYANHRHLK